MTVHRITCNPRRVTSASLRAMPVQPQCNRPCAKCCLAVRNTSSLSTRHTRLKRGEHLIVGRHLHTSPLGRFQGGSLQLSGESAAVGIGTSSGAFSAHTASFSALSQGRSLCSTRQRL